MLTLQKGAIIKDISEKFGFDKVQIDFSKDEGKCGIALEGTPSELESVQKELERRIADIRSTTAHVELDIPAAYHPHLIGKGGANLKKLDKEHKVTIKIPQDASQKVWIEGPPEGVKKVNKFNYFFYLLFQLFLLFFQYIFHPEKSIHSPNFCHLILMTGASIKHRQARFSF